MTEPADGVYTMVRRLENSRPYVELWRRDGNAWLCVSHPTNPWTYLPWRDVAVRDSEGAPVEMRRVDPTSTEPGS